MQQFTFVALLISLILIAAGCVTPPPESGPIVTPVVEPVQVTDTPAAAETEPAPGPTTTPTLGAAAAAQATAQAMAEQATLPTRTPSAQGDESEAANGFVEILDKTCQIVKDNYVRDDFNGVNWGAVCDEYRSKVKAAGSQDEFWGIMEAFIGELNDDHSRFVRPDRLDAEFGLAPPDELADRRGLGLIVWPAREDEQLVLWYVCDQGPAVEAGLRRGDVILAINGQPVLKSEDGFDWRMIRRALYGGGDAVTLTVQRGPERAPEVVELDFGTVAGCDGWRWELLSHSPRIGYVRVPEFSGDAGVNILRAIDSLEEDQPLDGLIVDVRHNPGGNADRSIAVFTAGRFGKVGPLRQDATQTIYRIRGPVRWNETTPVAVLTDGNSHSAAEYFATAMQQSGRALLVGQPTAGNTEGITGFNLPDGSLIRLAVSTLQLPDGSTLEEQGVVPDVQVSLGPWGRRQSPDVQVRAAYEALAGKILP